MADTVYQQNVEIAIKLVASIDALKADADDDRAEVCAWCGEPIGASVHGAFCSRTCLADARGWLDS